MELIFVIAIIGFFIWNLRLSSRIEELETRQQSTTRTETALAVESVPNASRAPVAVAQPPEAMPSSVLPPPPPQFTPQPPQFTPHTTQSKPSTSWWSENILIKIGAFIFFLGAVWFVGYAISQGWISPVMRIILGILLGIACYAIAEHRKSVNQTQYLVLITLGSGIIIASIYAGQFLFSLFIPVFALLLLILVISFTVFVSVQTKTEWLALTSVLAGFFAPLMINNQTSDPILFFGYLLVLSLGFLYVVTETRWRSITLTLLIGVTMYQNIWHASGQISDGMLWFFVLVFAALFYTASSVSLARTNQPESIDIATLGIGTIALVIWTTELASYDALAVFMYTLIVAGTGYLFHTLSRHERIIAVYAGLALTLLLIATSLQFEGYTLALAFTFEISFAIALALYYQLPRWSLYATCVAYVLPGTYAISLYDEQAWRESIFQPSAYALYAIVFSTLLLAMWAMTLSRRYNRPGYLKATSTFLLLFWVYSVLVSGAIWKSLVTDQDIAIILDYVSWAILSYLLVSMLLHLRLPTSWLRFAVASLALPIFMSINSFVSYAWERGATHPDAVGLYFLTALLFLLGVTLMKQKNIQDDEHNTLAQSSRVLVSVSGLYLVALVWIVTHAVIVSDDVATSVALFVYTLAGLTCYVIGRNMGIQNLKIAGGLLLAGVVCRLLLVEVWSMEVLGRIFTFLGIGLLFILAAFIEKPFTHNVDSEHTPSN